MYFLPEKIEPGKRKFWKKFQQLPSSGSAQKKYWNMFKNYAGNTEELPTPLWNCYAKIVTPEMFDHKEERQFGGTYPLYTRRRHTEADGSSSARVKWFAVNQAQRAKFCSVIGRANLRRSLKANQLKRPLKAPVLFWLSTLRWGKYPSPLSRTT